MSLGNDAFDTDRYDNDESNDEEDHGYAYEEEF